jgi:hypothetical protein
VHGLLYRPGYSVNGISLPEVRKWRGAILDCNLWFGDNRYMEGGGEGVGSPFSGCVKSETGKKGQAPK